MIRLPDAPALWSIAAAVLIAAGCSSGHAAVGEAPEAEASETATAETATEPAASATPAPGASVRKLVSSLNAMTGGSASPAEMASWTSKIEAKPAAIAAYIGTLIESPEFTRNVASSLIFGRYVSIGNYYALPSGYTLQRTGGGIYYLRKPCSAAEAVSVTPWWDLSQHVRVCPGAYKPKRWTMSPEEHGYKSDMPLTCDSQVGSPEQELEPLCGCGPYLIRCLRDMDQYFAFQDSIVEEVKATTQYVLANDLPIEALFTSNSTFRDRNAELLYRRHIIGVTHNADVPTVLAGLESWPEDGKWAARELLAPGQHAGVLTAPQILHFAPDRRQRQRVLFQILWCSANNSFGATTNQILALNDTANLAFVHDSWKRLAHTEPCTSCHARLDYGFQFFFGYPDSRASTHFVPALQKPGDGPLYGADIDDPRGRARLSPNGFAKLATSQPDFDDCMTGHVVRYALGDDASDADWDAVREQIAEQHSFTGAMRVALLRYADRWQKAAGAGAAKPAAFADPKGSAPAGKVAIAAPLRADLDEHCVACHDSIPYQGNGHHLGQPFDLRGDVLPRRLLVRSADYIAFGKMPKEPMIMTDDERRRVLRRLIATLWEDEAARKEAATYYLGKMRALPAQQIDNAFGVIAKQSGADPGGDWALLERAVFIDQMTYTPGFAAATGMQALRACLAADLAADLDACLDETLSVSRLVRGRVH